MNLQPLLRVGRDDSMNGGSSLRTRGPGTWALVAGAMAAYVVTFVLLSPALGSQVGILATLPVVLAAWRLGLRGGLLVSLLAISINTLGSVLI